MAVPITVEDVLAVYPDLAGSDAAIAMYISVMDCKLDECLEASYPDCPDLQKAIKINAVAHMAAQSGQDGSVTARKNADGNSESYSQGSTDPSSLDGTPYGRVLLALDSAQCYQKAFSPPIFMASTGGQVLVCN